MTPARRASAYQRELFPRPMRFTARDGRILEAIHAYDGALADYHVQALFFTGRTQLRTRLRFLFQHGYLARPTYKQRASLPHMIYWLDKKGAEYVAGLSGTPLSNFPYLKEPRWSQLAHDLALIDVRIAVTKACEQYPLFTLLDWIPQSEFYRHPDRVEFADPRGRTARRYVRPDGYVILRQGPHLFRLLLELDMATETNVRFAREKVLPGLAYLKSAAYQERFGHPSGRFLVITTTERKLGNLKRQTERAAGKDARLFYFTTLGQVRPETVLTGAIWQQGGGEQPTALFNTVPERAS